MKKTYLLAGFFILSSSLQSFAFNSQTDTLPVKKAYQSYKTSNINYQLSFYRWRNSSYSITPTAPANISLSSDFSLVPAYSPGVNISWWPQLNEVYNKQNVGIYALTGFAHGVSTGLSTTNNYYLKNAYNWEINKSFYSISSFVIGAGLGTALGLKDPKRFHW
jgi:hypothetical protein